MRMTGAQHSQRMQGAQAEEWLPSVLHDAYCRWHESLHSGDNSSLHVTAGGGVSRPSVMRPSGALRQTSLAGLHAAPRGLLASALVTGPEAATPVGIWPARLLQLKLAARNMGRCSPQSWPPICVLSTSVPQTGKAESHRLRPSGSVHECGGKCVVQWACKCQKSWCVGRCRWSAKQSRVDNGVTSAAEWATMAALLAQMLGAHLTTLQGAAHDAAAAACNRLWAVAGATAGTNDR